MKLKKGVPTSFDRCKKLAKKLGYKISIRKNGWYKFLLKKNGYEIFGFMWSSIPMLLYGLEQLEFKRARGIS